MPSIYEEMREVAQELTVDFATGTVTMKRPTGTLPSPDAAYDPDFTMVADEWTLDAVVIGVIAEYVDGSVIGADDLMVITSPYAVKTGGSQEVVEFNSITDEFFIDGKQHTVCKIERIPAAGLASGFFIFVKS